LVVINSILFRPLKSKRKAARRGEIAALSTGGSPAGEKTALSVFED
jgi:hypothetical protein